MPRTATKPTSSRKPKADTKAARTADVRKKYKGTTTMAAAAQVSPDKPLTDMQKDFIRRVADGESITNAMQLAGYNDQPSYGYRILKMPNAQALLQQYQQELRERTLVTREKVVAMHMEAFDLARLMAEPASMVAAAREIGKMHGFYEPKKIELTVNGQPLQKKMEQMSTQELEDLIRNAQSAHADSQGIEYAGS